MATATSNRRRIPRLTVEERVELADELRTQLRLADPRASEQEIGRRADLAAGLAREGDQPSAREQREALETPGGRPRAAARRVGAEARTVITSSGARKTIFGVMGLAVFFGIVRDIRSGQAITTDVIPRRIIGTLIATILLMILAGPAPRAARGLAILVGFVTVALNREVIAAISSRAAQEGQSRETSAPDPTATPVERGLSAIGR